MSALVYLQRSTEPRRPNGLWPLWLDLYQGSTRMDRLTVVSGAPAYQSFRLAADGHPGSLEPIPEGRYEVGAVEWAAGDENWGATWGLALGPWWCTISPLQSMRRGDFGLHMDWNSGSSPGTAGCIAFDTRESARRWLAWRGAQTGPVLLVVDWGLGSVEAPPSPVQSPRTAKIYLSEDRSSAMLAGRRVEAMEVRLRRDPDGSLHYWRDGREYPAEWMRFEAGEKT